MRATTERERRGCRPTGTLLRVRSAAVGGTLCLVVALLQACTASTVLNEAKLLITQASRWSVLGVEDFTGGSAENLSLALDPSGNPYLAFEDGAQGNKITVMKYSGGSWAAVGSPGFASGSGPIIRVDGSGIPFVAFADAANQIKVMKLVSSAWTDVGTTGISSSSGVGGFALDSSDNLFVAFSDDAHNSNPNVAVFNGSSWQLLGPGGATGTTFVPTDTIRIAVDSNGMPSIAYLDSNTTKNLIAMTYTGVINYTGTAWDASTGIGVVSNLEARYPSMAFDSSQSLYLAYSEELDNYAAVVKKISGGSMSQIGGSGVDATNGEADGLSLSLDSSGAPYLSYLKGSTAATIGVVRYDTAASSWDDLGFPGIKKASRTAIAIDGTGTVYLAYVDSDNGDKATVYSYTK